MYTAAGCYRPAPMDVTVLYFAALRDLAGCPEQAVSLPPDVRVVGDLPAFLARLHPSFAGRLDQVRIARNEAFARPDEALAAGDVIALIPPVAGG